jgi:hypothetical protein
MEVETQAIAMCDYSIFDQIPDELLLDILLYYGDQKNIKRILGKLCPRIHNIIYYNEVFQRYLCKCGSCDVPKLQLSYKTDTHDSIDKVRNNEHHHSFMMWLYHGNIMRGTRDLCDALTHNTTIYTLSLEENHMDDKCIVEIANFVRTNTTIHTF